MNISINDYQTFKEVLTPEELNTVVNEFIETQNSIDIKTRNTLDHPLTTELLYVLSEKYSKFHDSFQLSHHQRTELNKILVSLTDFSDLRTMEDLTSILFNFRFDEYYFFLKDQFPTSNASAEVVQELFVSLDEYEERKKQNWPYF